MCMDYVRLESFSNNKTFEHQKKVEVDTMDGCTGSHFAVPRYRYDSFDGDIAERTTQMIAGHAALDTTFPGDSDLFSHP